MNCELGFGVGFRLPHYQQILQANCTIDYFELISENFITLGGQPKLKLDWLKERFPLVLHGVSMSLGSVGPLNKDYLDKLKRLVRYCQPKYVTDHLCWSSYDGVYLHDLIPLPYTDEVITHFINKINLAQEHLEIPIGLENLSSYIDFNNSKMTEWEFVSEIIAGTKSYLLLDINNVYVSAVNHQFDPWQYLTNIPQQSVCQVHLAGHTTLENGRKLDTHSKEPCPEVWQLYHRLIEEYGPVNTLIEWDENTPSFKKLQGEALKAKQITEGLTSLTHSIP